MSVPPRRRASDRKLPARIGHFLLRGWHAWTSHSRETISPGAALWLTILSVWLFAQAHDSAQTAQQAKAASGRTRVLAVDNAKNARVAKALADQLNGAVCAWRGDLEDRVVDQRRKIKRSTQFLKDHPKGLLGISPKLLAAGVDADKVTLKNLKKTVDAFESVDCR